MAKQNKPAIRFKEFTDAWEQRKLSEIAGKVTEKNTGLQYVETLTNSAEFGIISQRDFFDHDISKLDSLDGYYIVRNEDFVYNPRISTSAPVGPINRNKLGRTGVMSPLYTVFRPHDIDTTYLEHFFKCGYWYSFMNFNGDSGARSDRFSIKDDVFFQMPIPVPHIEEQRKIGLFLTQLDHLITLHQRKYDKLQVLKKAMLEKMFPKNGSSVPEIRFKGFTDAWEQRKLSELLYLSSERNNGSYTRDDVLAASLGTELQKKHIYFGLRATDESVKNYKVVLPNDVIYTKSPIKGFPNGIIRTSKGENGIVPTLYCVYHSVDVINPSIIQAYFESKERLDAYLVPLVNIGARNNVNITDKEFLDGSLCIPKDKAEQDKIVDVLERLSNLITLHQRKLDTLKYLKEAMLEKMFV